MIRQRMRSIVGICFVLSLLVVWTFNSRQASHAAQFAQSPATGAESMAEQIKELQKQVAELQTQVKSLKSPRIIHAGTATIKLGPQQDNKTSVRVKLPADVVSQLGGNCIIELTNRYPTGYDFFVPYWRPATDGFDVLIADPSLVGVGLNVDRNIPYYIDWIVVQK